MAEKEHPLLSALNYFKWQKKLIESNIKHDKDELAEMDRLGKEREITEPIVVPDGYIDREKDLKEQIEISKKLLKEAEETILDIYKASFSMSK